MLTPSPASQVSLRRDAWIEVDLNAIEHNLACIKRWIKPGTQVMAVVKGDAYGHGASDLAPILEAAGVYAFGVASVDEGCQLREAGAKNPILVLGPCPTWAIRHALDAGLSLTINSISQIDEIIAESDASSGASIHLKVDTGMHRLGLSIDEVKPAIQKISAAGKLKLSGLYSHLAAASNSEITAKQNKLFQAVISQLIATTDGPELVHLASSEAIKQFPETHYDLVRAGLYLYGLEPKTISNELRPAMSVRGRINQLKKIESGDSVGYGLTWTARRKSLIASIPVGYADGVDRRLSNNINGLLLGQRVKQVGLISMDQMLFDVTDVAQVCEGDVITLIGSDGDETLYMADWAKQLDTITYELCSGLRVRMPRVYTRHKLPNHKVG